VLEQQAIIEALGVVRDFDAATEARRRTDFLADYLKAARLETYVLGISGGVDSLAAALLAQRAVAELRDTGYQARFIAVRLPYGVQADEADAQRALDAIGADEVLRVDIKPAANAMLASLRASGLHFGDAGREDFLLGNIKARERMVAQYAIAGATRGLVIGTDHAAEALMGFFTKHGDGAADVLPLAGLNKRRVRAIAALLGAPSSLVGKVPTADLENLAPLRPDEDAYGVTYEQIDDFLEGKEIDDDARRRILQTYSITSHKRSLAITPGAVDVVGNTATAVGSQGVDQKG
jgi:NAD+ synthase